MVSPVAPGTTIGVGVPIKFDAKDSFDPNPGGTITNYAWNFGDGSTTGGTTAKTTHTYTLNGTYTVTLTVTDNFGNTGTVSHKVNVIPAPIIDTGNFRFKRNLNQGNVGLTQTWIIGVINPNAFPIDINMVISGSIDTAGAFSVQSGPVLIQPGAEVFITLTNTFNNADKGSTVNFQVAVYFTTNTVNPGPVSGFTLGPVITDSFRIRP